MSNARSHLADAKVVRISGSGTDGGDKVKLDMTYVGKTAAGTVTLDGAKLRLLKAQGKAYFKGSDAFYRQAAGANAAQFKQLVNGRWILIDPKGKDGEGLRVFIDRKEFLSGLAAELKGTFEKGKGRRIAGIPCIAVRDASGTAWLDTRNGSLVRLDTGDGQGLNFSYKRARPAKPPAPEDVVDLDSLS